MHEVKVYDPKGKLKQVISVDSLNAREDRKTESPDYFRRNRKNLKPGARTPANPVR